MYEHWSDRVMSKRLLIVCNKLASCWRLRCRHTQPTRSHSHLSSCRPALGAWRQLVENTGNDPVTSRCESNQRADPRTDLDGVAVAVAVDWLTDCRSADNRLLMPDLQGTCADYSGITQITITQLAHRFSFSYCCCWCSELLTRSESDRLSRGSTDNIWRALCTSHGEEQAVALCERCWL